MAKKSKNDNIIKTIIIGVAIIVLGSIVLSYLNIGSPNPKPSTQITAPGGRPGATKR